MFGQLHNDRFSGENVQYPHPKKTRCQVINTLSQSQEADTSTRRNVSFLCEYLGISRQGYYKYMTQEKEEEILGTSIVLYATELRKDLPKAGMRELYELCRRKFQYKFSIGRDQCYTISSSLTTSISVLTDKISLLYLKIQ